MGGRYAILTLAASLGISENFASFTGFFSWPASRKGRQTKRLFVAVVKLDSAIPGSFACHAADNDINADVLGLCCS